MLFMALYIKMPKNTCLVVFVSTIKKATEQSNFQYCCAFIYPPRKNLASNHHSWQ